MPRLDSFGFPPSSCFTLTRANPTKLLPLYIPGFFVALMLPQPCSCGWVCFTTCAGRVDTVFDANKPIPVRLFLHRHCVNLTFRIRAIECVRSLTLRDLAGSRKPLEVGRCLSPASNCWDPVLLVATRILRTFLRDNSAVWRSLNPDYLRISWWQFAHTNWSLIMLIFPSDATSMHSSQALLYQLRQRYLVLNYLRRHLRYHLIDPSILDVRGAASPFAFCILQYWFLGCTLASFWGRKFSC